MDGFLYSSSDLLIPKLSLHKCNGYNEETRSPLFLLPAAFASTYEGDFLPED